MPVYIRENKVETKVNEWAKSQDILHCKMRPYEVGWPDQLYVGRNGRVAFAEFKSPSKPLVAEPVQTYRQTVLKERGFPAGLFNDRDHAITFLDAALVPRKSGGPSNISSLLGTSAVAGPWKDYDYLLRHLYSVVKEAYKEDTRSGPSPGMLQCLAETERLLGGFLASTSGDSSRKE